MLWSKHTRASQLYTLRRIARCMVSTASCRHRRTSSCSSECGQETERSARASLPLNSESRGTLASLSVCIRRQTYFAGTMCSISKDLKRRGAYHTPGRGNRNQYSSCRSCLRSQAEPHGHGAIHVFDAVKTRRRDRVPGFRSRLQKETSAHLAAPGIGIREDFSMQ